MIYVMNIPHIYKTKYIFVHTHKGLLDKMNYKLLSVSPTMSGYEGKD